MAPVISSISPVQGPAAGGMVVTITGSGFTGATGVMFGSVSAPFTVVSSTKITATAPAGSGSVTVTVTTPGGTSNGATYSYVAAPVITGISPVQGPAAGGTAVTINGTGFTGATAVVFGSASAAFTVVSSTQISATAPAGSGSVTVTVTTPGGTSNGATYSYVAAPVVNTLSPAQGPSAGGNTVTITGTGFTGVTAVMFGSAPAAFTVLSSTQITATAPAGSGSVTVTVTTPGGTSNGATYSYVAAPVVNTLSPRQGPSAGGNTVTITGTGFTGVTGVMFGSVSAAFTVVSATQITATAPAGAVAPVAVTVITAGGTSNAVLYYYLPLPTVAALSPSTGPVAGGNTVTITGTGLTLTTAVHFGSGAATAVTIVSDNQITVHAPSGTGTVAVTVTTPGGTSLPGVGSPYYTYVALPVISALTPAQGPATGGTAVTITGSNLGLTTSVLFGGVAVPFVVLSDTEVVATNPGGTPSLVAVTVTTPGGVSNTANYQLLAAPSV
jgi:hypothetical protein